MAALVGADRLEMTEGVAHEVNRRAPERIDCLLEENVLAHLMGHT